MRSFFLYDFLFVLALYSLILSIKIFQSCLSRFQTSLSHSFYFKICSPEPSLIVHQLQGIVYFCFA